VGGVLKVIGIVGLVLLVLLLVIPLGIAMVMGPCPDCPGTGVPASMNVCLAMLAGLVLLIALGTTSIRPARFDGLTPLYARSIERPPRTV
jgi:hypothetical protein